ncbi:MAG: ATP-binding cassette domain-containing protein [Chlamydiota bacterium]
MSEILASIDNLTKIFSPKLPPALKDIQATIPKGEILGLVGPDGAGKTTLIRLLAALLLPTQGKITICGFDTVADPETIHFITSYMPQKFGLYEDLTVLQNLNLYADLKGVIGEERKEKTEKLLTFTGLSPFTSRFAKDLSGGMKQKLGLACALIKKPSLLLLDEPSVGVDPLSRRELWKMVSDLVADGISVVWSTAYLDEAEKCNHILMLNQGKLLYSGSPQDLTNRVLGRTFAISNIEGDRRHLLFQVLQDKNVMDGTIQGQNLRVVVREKKEPLMDQKIQSHFQIESIAPRLEDGFMDILGGGPGGFSALADRAPFVKSETEEVIVADGLTKTFGNFTAAHEISFVVKKGEIFGLLGPNGAGKSTTFKMMCGLLRPTEGKAYVANLDLQKAPGKARSRLGYMAQKFSLYGNLNVRQNLEFFSGIYNLQGEQKAKLIQEMIEVFNLDSYLTIPAESLSLGYKQRLALACANMHHPDVLFLDEPTSGVDPVTRREFWNHINGLVEKGVTIMVTTHFMDEAEYCDRIALVYRGKIIDMNTPNGLKDRVRSPTNPNPTLEDAFVKLIEAEDAR